MECQITNLTTPTSLTVSSGTTLLLKQPMKIHFQGSVSIILVPISEEVPSEEVSSSEVKQDRSLSKKETPPKINVEEKALPPMKVEPILKTLKRDLYGMKIEPPRIKVEKTTILPPLEGSQEEPILLEKLAIQTTEQKILPSQEFKETLPSQELKEMEEQKVTSPVQADVQPLLSVVVQKITPVLRVEYVNFDLGRKTQHISDRWPRIPRKPGRAIEMAGLLPKLTATPELIEENFRITLLESTIWKVDTSTPPSKDLSHLSTKEQFQLGKDWQFLLDTDMRKWTHRTVDALSLDSVRNEATELKNRLNNGWFNFVKNKEFFQRLFDEVDIVECYGIKKCRESYSRWNSTHCVSCNGELTLEDVVKAYKQSFSSY
jgi:hypothetical protein